MSGIARFSVEYIGCYLIEKSSNIFPLAPICHSKLVFMFRLILLSKRKSKKFTQGNVCTCYDVIFIKQQRLFIMQEAI